MNDHEAPDDEKNTTHADRNVNRRRKRRSEERSDVDGVARYERAVGRFLRRFTLPETADADSIKAKSANGILEITIPKQAAVQARRITVDAA